MIRLLLDDLSHADVVEATPASIGVCNEQSGARDAFGHSPSGCEATPFIKVFMPDAGHGYDVLNGPVRQ